MMQTSQTLMTWLQDNGCIVPSYTAKPSSQIYSYRTVHFTDLLTYL